MKPKTWIKKLHKKRIVSEQPHPLIPFVLFFIILTGAMMSHQRTDVPFIIAQIMYILAGLTLIFAVLHWFVWRVVR